MQQCPRCNKPWDGEKRTYCSNNTKWCVVCGSPTGIVGNPEYETTSEQNHSHEYWMGALFS